MTRRSRTAPEPARPPEKGATAERLYSDLKQAILRLELPPSAPLEESRLVERFAFSRTPVREALTRLAAEGLVELRAHRSAVVAPISAQSVAAYFEALGYLSVALTRLAALRRTPAQLAGIRHCQDQFGTLLREEREFDRGERNRDFHMAVATAANNRFLSEQYKTLLDRGVRLANIPFYSEEDEGEDLDAHFRLSCDDHEVLIASIADRDGDRAEAITLRHVDLFRHRITKFLHRYGDALIHPQRLTDRRELPTLRHAAAVAMEPGEVAVERRARRTA